MFRKVEIWFLYLIILMGLPITVGFGALVRHELVNEGYGLRSINLGWISKNALFFAEIPTNFKQIFREAQAKELQVIKDRFPNLNNFDGMPNNKESYLLLSKFDGDLKEGVVELIDLTNFEVLHTWNPDINKFNSLVDKIDEFEYLDRDHNNSRSKLIHPKLLNDGGLVFAQGTPLRKIDECSNLIFQNTHDQFHHSIETDIEGNLWVPSHMFPQTLSSEKIGRDTLAKGGYNDDAIVKLSPDGIVLFEKSVSQIFIDNELEYLLFSVGDRIFDKDPIHLNDIQPVDFDGKYWKKGDIFLSLRHQSMVFLYRPSTNKIIWKGTGPFFHQHDVNILDKNRISIFNNNSKVFFDDKEIVEGHNEVIIYDFETDKYSTYLSESLVKNDVRTNTSGRSQILPNGDLFVEESNFGRSLYFNSDGSLRWTHLNRADNKNVYSVGWSRILFTKNDIVAVERFMRSRGKCDS